MARRLALAAALAAASLWLACTEDREPPVSEPPAAAAQPDPKDTRELIAAVRDYAEQGCAAAKARLDRCRPCETEEQRPLRDLLYAYCAERETPQVARALYEAIAIAYPGTGTAQTALFRLRQLETPAKAAPAPEGASPAPTAIERPAASFPKLAEAAGVEGRVRVRFDVRDDGRTENARVVEAEPPLLFDTAALAAISRWRYEPKPTPDVQVVLRFELANQSDAAAEAAQ